MAALKRSTGSGTGNWTSVPNGTKVKRSTGSGTGNWSNPKHVWYSTGSGTGNWVKTWSKSDPVTYSFYATNSGSWRPSGWRSSNECRVGSYGYGDHICVMDFTADTDDTTGITLATAIAARPTCTSLSVAVFRMSGSGASTTATGSGESWYMGQYDGTIGSGDADDSINTTNMTTFATGADSWGSNVDRAFTLNTSLASALSTKELWIANRTSSFSSDGGTDATYSALAPHTNAFKALITVTLDY